MRIFLLVTLKKRIAAEMINEISFEKTGGDILPPNG